MQIQPINTAENIEKCFDTFLELRPHLEDRQSFVAQVSAQCKEGYQLVAAVVQGEVAACIGFRRMTTLAWGKIVYIDDLITRAQYRGKGYGSILLESVITRAREEGHDQVHLDSGYTRNVAHRVYLNHGFNLSSHHLSLVLRK